MKVYIQDSLPFLINAFPHSSPTPATPPAPPLPRPQLLAEEGAKCRRLKEQLAESEILQGKISSLTRRCEDVSRAYEQEKKVRTRRSWGARLDRAAIFNIFSLFSVGEGAERS